jgi:hypothetical protein
MHPRDALVVSFLILALWYHPQGMSAAHTGQRFDPRDLTGIWMQTPDRPFKAYPLTPEYEGVLETRSKSASIPCGTERTAAGS